MARSKLKEKKSKILGPPVGYTDLLDYAIKQKLLKEREENKKKKTTSYYPLRPSSSGFCARRLAYELMENKGYGNYDRDILTPDVYRLFDLGYSVEYSVLRMFGLVELIKTRYKQQGLTCFRMEPVGEEKVGRIIEGSCDACFISEKFKCIMDVKSAKDKYSRYNHSRWDDTLEKFGSMDCVEQISETAFYVDDVVQFVDELGEDFIRENIYQLNLYARSEFIISRGIDHAVIYKYNKNDSRHYEIRFRPSQALADRVKDKFDRVNSAVTKKKPEKVLRDYSLGSMHCSFCPFKSACWPGEDPKKEFFKVFPKKKWPKDLDRIPGSGELKEHFSTYEEAKIESEKVKNAELKILTLLQDKGLSKVKLDNGHVYEVRLLKSPRPHYELRRTKL